MSDATFDARSALVRIDDEGTAYLHPLISARIADFEEEIAKLKKAEDEMKAKILAEMEQHGIYKLETPELTVTYIAATGRETFDSKALRKECPELYDRFVKISPVSASVRIKVKEIQNDGTK